MTQMTVPVLLQAFALPVPLLQPVKVDPIFAIAVSVTADPAAKLEAQMAPQLIPAGTDITVPVPVPAGVTVSIGLSGMTVKVPTVLELTVKLLITQVPVPVQMAASPVPPLHPAKNDPGSGAAAIVTEVPQGNGPQGSSLHVMEPVPVLPGVIDADISGFAVD